MNHGVDTSFLIAAEAIGHADREWALSVISSETSKGSRFSLAPQVIAEFLHVITDPKRFERALAMDEARQVATRWWNSPVVDRVFMGSEAVAHFFDWQAKHHLGRKRILDTMLAATYFGSNVRSIVTTNETDFSVFEVFELRCPERPTA